MISSVKIRITAIFLALALLVFAFHGIVLAEEPQRAAEAGEWTNDNTVTAIIKEEYGEQVFGDIMGTFADVDPAAVYIIERLEYRFRVLIVLKESGDAAIEAAIAELGTNPVVEIAEKYRGAPYEPKGTLAINPPSATLRVGETIALTPSGKVTDRYEQGFSLSHFCIQIEDFDPKKEYTPADFPQYDDIISVSLHCMDGDIISGYIIELTLGTPGYFNLIKALNAFALAPSVSLVAMNIIVHYTMVVPSNWGISDYSVVDFADGYPQNYWGEDRSVKFTALKPGVITVSYFAGKPYMTENDEYLPWPVVTCEITVIADETADDEGSGSVDTGDSSAVFAVAALTLASAAAIMVLRKRG